MLKSLTIERAPGTLRAVDCSKILHLELNQYHPCSHLLKGTLYIWGMPFAASCIAAVNSVCHSPGGDIDASAKPQPCNIVYEGLKCHGGMAVDHYSHWLQSFSPRRGLIKGVIEAASHALDAIPTTQATPCILRS